MTRRSPMDWALDVWGALTGSLTHARLAEVVDAHNDKVRELSEIQSLILADPESHAYRALKARSDALGERVELQLLREHHGEARAAASTQRD